MKKYPIILADPAWPYKCWTKKGKGRTAAHHYDVMNISDIKALPVSSIATDDAVLFIWATNPLLPEAMETINAWGFEYKTTGFHWVKKNKRATDTLHWGMGHYTRANVESCLLAIRGKGLTRKSGGVHSVIEAPRGEHSAKPPETRERIVRLYGDVPRMELFARERAKGWDAIGNAIDGKDIRKVLSA